VHLSCLAIHLQTPYPYKPYPSVHAPWYGYLFWVYATAGGYNKNADTQFVTAYVDKQSPSGSPAPAPAPSSSSTKASAPASTSAPSSSKDAPAPAPSSSSSGSSSSSSSSNAPAAVVTEKGNQARGSNSNKRLASAQAIKAWQQQAKKQPRAPAKGEQKGRRLLAAQQLGPCDANLKVSFRVSVLTAAAAEQPWWLPPCKAGCAF